MVTQGNIVHMIRRYPCAFHSFRGSFVDIERSVGTIHELLRQFSVGISGPSDGKSKYSARSIELAIPGTLALTLAIFYLYGYTLNRVTLFALIFSIGILVDDTIVVVKNIVRHFRLPDNRGRPLADVAVEAVDEVGNPTILATFAVIAAILPMAFV
jgi:hypothetical protein